MEFFGTDLTTESPNEKPVAERTLNNLNTGLTRRPPLRGLSNCGSWFPESRILICSNTRSSQGWMVSDHSSSTRSSNWRARRRSYHRTPHGVGSVPIQSPGQVSNKNRVQTVHPVDTA